MKKFLLLVLTFIIIMFAGCTPQKVDTGKPVLYYEESLSSASLFEILSGNELAKIKPSIRSVEYVLEEKIGEIKTFNYYGEQLEAIYSQSSDNPFGDGRVDCYESPDGNFFIGFVADKLCSFSVLNYPPISDKEISLDEAKEIAAGWLTENYGDISEYTLTLARDDGDFYAISYDRFINGIKTRNNLSVHVKKDGRVNSFSFRFNSPMITDPDILLEQCKEAEATVRELFEEIKAKRTDVNFEYTIDDVLYQGGTSGYHFTVKVKTTDLETGKDVMDNARGTHFMCVVFE